MSFIRFERPTSLCQKWFCYIAYICFSAAHVNGFFERNHHCWTIGVKVRSLSVDPTIRKGANHENKTRICKIFGKKNVAFQGKKNQE